MIDNAAAADRLQAEYLRRCLIDERADLVRKLALHARILNDVKKVGRAAAVRHHRWCIRRLDNDVRVVDRMIDALDRRFPDAALKREA